MQHGIYLAEFERELFRRGFAISHHSLGQLVDRVDFSKLKDFHESDRFSFYGALAESISAWRSRGRGRNSDSRRR